jgi:hypothetical protein
MIRRIVKLMFYIKAPLKAFVLFHPVKAAKLWFAYVLGSALFGARRRAELAKEAGASGWPRAEGGGDALVQAAGESGSDAPARTNDGTRSAAVDVVDEAAPPVPAGASVPEGHQPA